jgi:hypothetical protein
MRKGMSKKPADSQDGSRPSRTKQRRTFTLSPEAVALLDDLSADSTSASSVLDALLLSLRREKKRQEMEERIARYYDQRSEEERREEALWGDFATREFMAAELSRLRWK